MNINDLINDIYDQDNNALNITSVSATFNEITSQGSAISSGDFAGFPASNAFDGDLGTFWLGANDPGEIGEYIGLFFKVPTLVSRFNFQGVANRLPTSLSFEYSQNGTDWVNVCTCTPSTGDNIETLDTSITAHYIRFVSGSATTFQFGTNDIKIYQREEGTDSSSEHDILNSVYENNSIRTS